MQAKMSWSAKTFRRCALDYDIIALISGVKTRFQTKAVRVSRKSSGEKTVRKVKQQQMKLGEVSIADIAFDPRSRDEIPQLLRGLQHIWCTPELREQVFAILQRVVPEGTNPHTGRPGMELWKVLVLGTLRLNCNWDYDKVQEMANQHNTLRQMLGHALLDRSYKYPLQTIRDNVGLLTPAVLDEINQVVVTAGHTLVKKNYAAGLSGRCDSFVVQTDVHFPTDINLLLDAVRKVIELTARLCARQGIDGWRQSRHNFRTIKRLYRRAQQLNRSNSRDEAKRAERQEQIKQAHAAYVAVAEHFVARATGSLRQLRQQHPAQSSILAMLVIEGYIQHARRQIDQVRRRVMQGEAIAHTEKVFSVFEEHTEWIKKGKAGVPQELGLKVCVLEDQYGFLLHHRVMQQHSDAHVALPMVVETQQRYAGLCSCSFDKGFYTPANRQALAQVLEMVVLPAKGKLSSRDTEVEHTREFIRSRKRHSAVESAINALENHGLDRCLDHGLAGFKRYVALAVVARNMQMLGRILQKQELKRLKRCQKPDRLAA